MMEPKKDRRARFPNLARAQPADNAVIEEVSAIALAELEAAGINAFAMSLPCRGEVPSRVIGWLSLWQFRRAWYYWIAEGPGLPVEVAEKLHAQHGHETRVGGDCTCPSPQSYKGFGVPLYHVDGPAGLKALAEAIKSVDPGR
jgi:hypothetical protein